MLQISKKTFLIALILIGFLQTKAQETKPITISKDGIYEEYSVLTSNKKIKHGSYLKLGESLSGPNKVIIFGESKYNLIVTGNYDNGLKVDKWDYYFENFRNQIKEEGYYKNDLKDSLWISYFPERMSSKLIIDENTGAFSIENINTSVKSKGQYDKGVRIKVWDFYSPSQELIQKYDYDKKLILFDATSVDSTNREAVFIGQEYEMKDHLHQNFAFHDLMERVSILHLDSGELKLQFTIAPDGSVKDIIERKNTISNKKVVTQAHQTVQSLNGHWIPKTQLGIPKESTKTITFSLGSNTKFDNSISQWGTSSRMSIRINYDITVD